MKKNQKTANNTFHYLKLQKTKNLIYEPRTIE